MKVDTKINVNMAGYYKFEAERVHDDGRRERRTLIDWFSNLITDTGLDQIATTYEAIGYAHVGSGASPAVGSKNNLDNQIASVFATTGANGIAATSPRFGWRRLTYTFGKGVAAGNLAEVGIGPVSDNNNLFSRSLIKDDNGNPTTITVLDNEILYVTYELRVYVNEADTNGSVTISGVTYNFIQRALDTNGAHWNYVIPNLQQSYARVEYLYAGNGNLNEMQYQGPNIPNNYRTGNYVSYADYVPGSHQQDINGFFDINDGNDPNGLNVFWLYTNIGAFQFKLDKPIPKDNTKTLSMTLRLSWGRYNP